MNAKIDCRKLNKTIKAEQDKSVFEILKKNDIPIASSCKGEGVCKWCKITILFGSENLNSLSELEKMAHLQKDERLSCQAYCTDNIVISTTYW